MSLLPTEGTYFITQHCNSFFFKEYLIIDIFFLSFRIISALKCYGRTSYALVFLNKISVMRMSAHVLLSVYSTGNTVKTCYVELML